MFKSVENLLDEMVKARVRKMIEEYRRKYEEAPEEEKFKYAIILSLLSELVDEKRGG